MKALVISILAMFGFVPQTESVPTQEIILVGTAVIPKSDYIKQKEIEIIDTELESLLNLRDYYTGKVARYRHRASRYELQGENLDESKHLGIEADKLDGVITQIDEEITRLEKERAHILKS
jgi:hypothetical protein